MLHWFSEEEDAAHKLARDSAEAAISCTNQDGTPTLHEGSYASGLADSIRPGGSGFVAVYDATNSTTDRRKTLYDTCLKNGVQVMFIESVCDDMDVIMSNIREVTFLYLMHNNSG